MKFSKLFHILTLAAVTLTAASSCGGGEEDDFILNPSGATNPSTGSSAFTLASIKSRIEVPMTLKGNDFVYHVAKLGQDSVLNYCLEYDSDLHHSRWVAFRFDESLAAKSVGRKDYSIKPQYPKDPNCANSLPDDASFRGFDHGHLCASNDRICCKEANWQTFYMTNMSPQYSKFNQDYWVTYEQFVQNLARKNGFADTLYVVKGGTILANQRLGMINTSGFDVPVPKYYFIALLKAKNNTYSSIGLWVEHEENPRGSGQKEDISQHVITIDELEELTGIDFFHNLPDNVETAVESMVQKSAWNL